MSLRQGTRGLPSIAPSVIMRGIDRELAINLDSSERGTEKGTIALNS